MATYSVGTPVVTPIQATPIEAIPIQAIPAVPVPATHVTAVGTVVTATASVAPSPSGGESEDTSKFKQDLCGCGEQCGCLCCASFFCCQTMTPQLYQMETKEPGSCDKWAKVLWALTILAYTLNMISRVADVRILGIVAMLFTIAYTCCGVRLLMLVRSSVRQRYRIPPGQCGDCDDCCCSFWCTCCTQLQLMTQFGVTNQNYQLCHKTAGLAMEV